MKTKSIVIVGLALLVGGFFLFSNRPESIKTQPQTIAMTTKAKAETPAPKKSYGGTFHAKSVIIADSTQPTIQPN